MRLLRLALLVAGCASGKGGVREDADEDTAAADTGPRPDTGTEDSGCSGRDSDVPGDFSSSDVSTEVTSGEWNGFGVQAIAALMTDAGEAALLGVPGWGGVSPSAGEVVLLPAQVSVSGEADSVATAVIRGESQSFLGGYVATGDLDADGSEEVFLGAPGYLQEGNFHGAVYVLPSNSLVGETNVEDLGIRLVGSRGSAAGPVAFGADSDGTSWLGVGAPAAEDPSGLSGGAAYLLTGPVAASGDVESLATGAFFGALGDTTGAALALADVDGDGLVDLLAGATFRDGAAGNEGAAFLIRGPVSGFLGPEQADLLLVGEGAGSHFGTALAAGDLNDDGLADMIVGAPGQTRDGVEDSGAVFLFDGAALAAGSAVAAATLEGRSGSAAGSSVAVRSAAEEAGVVIGAPGFDAGTGHSGAVFYVSQWTCGSRDLADVRAATDPTRGSMGYAVGVLADASESGAVVVTSEAGGWSEGAVGGALFLDVGEFE